MFAQRAEAAGLTLADCGQVRTGEYHTFQIEDIATISVWAEGHRVLVNFFFLWSVQTEDEMASRFDAWQRMQRLLATYLHPDHGVPYGQWATAEGFGAVEHLVPGVTVVTEKEFGNRVARIENRLSDVLGWAAFGEIATAYRPWHEINEEPAPASWADMQKGLTLEEVEAFAGEGYCTMSVGEAQQYEFPDHKGPITPWVNFTNGRADAWQAPPTSSRRPESTRRDPPP